MNYPVKESLLKKKKGGRHYQRQNTVQIEEAYQMSKIMNKTHNVAHVIID